MDQGSMVVGASEKSLLMVIARVAQNACYVIFGAWLRS